MSRDWLLDTGIDALGFEDEPAQERYKYFMRPEPFEDMGPIEVVYDVMTGREMRSREIRVGMTRNAPKKTVQRVYLDPLPHIRIAHAKQLQGWYKAKGDELEGKRPRPCFTDAILTEPYGGYCTVGCAFSLPAGELIDTPKGPRAIETIRTGDLVWGRYQTGIRPTRVVGTTSHRKPEGHVRVKLADGRELRLTADHPLYSQSRGWTSAGDLRQGERLEGKLERAQRTHQMPRGDQSQTSEDVPLWRRFARAVEETLRRLFVSTSMYCSSREYGGSGEQRHTEIHRDQSQDESLCAGSSREHGCKSTRDQTEPRVLCTEGRRCAYWKKWVPPFQERQVHMPIGPRFLDALRMGMRNCKMVGRERVQLGVRTLRVAFAQWSVSAGFSIGRWVFAGSERVSLSQRAFEDSRSPSRRASGHLTRSTDFVPTWNIVEGVQIIPGEIKVFDIQTESENFYQQGILSHNCYINSGARGYRGSGLITVPLGYGAQIAEQLRSMNTSAAGYFSSFTDPFLPLEDLYHNTQQAAEAFVREGLPIFFLSRLHYPGWAVGLLFKNKYSYAQKSLNTGNEADYRRFSPGAISLSDHIEEIRELRRRGVYTSIQVNPIVPGVTTHDHVRELFEKLAAVGNNHVIVKFIEAAYSWVPAMIDRIHRRFGAERGAKFTSLFTQNIGGQRTIAQEYRLEAHHLYRDWATKLGMTYATCYEYKYGARGKLGVSIGREFATSEQCHGHRVPMFTRGVPGLPFSEVAECPPTGCMYCADDNGGKARCGNEAMGAARALRLSDLCQPVYRPTSVKMPRVFMLREEKDILS